MFSVLEPHLLKVLAIDFTSLKQSNSVGIINHKHCCEVESPEAMQFCILAPVSDSGMSEKRGNANATTECQPVSSPC